MNVTLLGNDEDFTHSFLFLEISERNKLRRDNPILMQYTKSLDQKIEIVKLFFQIVYLKVPVARSTIPT